MSDMPDKCPKCGSEALVRMPFEYPSNRIHFRCDSFGYGKDIFGLANRSELCCEREERIRAEGQRNEAREQVRECEREIKDLTIRAQLAEKERDSLRELSLQLAKELALKCGDPVHKHQVSELHEVADFFKYRPQTMCTSSP